jgi:hypothetical protein
MNRTKEARCRFGAVFAAALPFLLLLPGCAPSEPEPTGPEAVALALFSLADLEEPSSDDLSRCFHPPEDDEQRAALLDALETLSRVDEVSVQRTEPLETLDRVAVELTAPLAGGGQAHFSVQLDGTDDGAWVVRWFRGPGVEWPAHRRPRGDGLSVSSPPRDE